MKKNDKGLALPGVVALIVFVIIILSVAGYSSFQSKNKREYEVFVQNAKDFGTKATTYRNERIKYFDEIYLVDLVDDHYIKSYKNPFGGGEECDLYESKVVFSSNGEKSVTLRCGEYLIDSQLWSSGNYKVYKVSAWDEKIGNALEAETVRLYKYQKNGVDVLNDYVVTKKLVTTYNQKEGKNIRTIQQIDVENIEVISKIFYRTKKLVKENL